MNILISGGTGFIGSALYSHLIRTHDVVIKTRRPELIDPNMKSIKKLSQISPDEKFDVVINLAGEPIADKRWSKSQRQKLLESRLDITEEFISFFKRTNNKPALFISSSAIEYYGVEATNVAIGEDDSGDDSFSSSLCTRWEESALQAEALGIRTCILRTGMVLGQGGGPLQKMLTPFKFGFGGNIGQGTQWMSWIHLSDLIGIIEYCIIDDKLKGPINCTAPYPVTNAYFTKALGKLLRRPTLFHIPSIIIKVLLGDMGKELLLTGKKVLPLKVQNAGFQFKYKNLEIALSDVLK